MGDQRLETLARRIELQLANGERLKGEVFLQLVGSRGLGAQRVGELLGSEDCFLPVRSNGRVTLVNLRQVVSLTVAAEDEADELSRLGEQYEVKVRTAVGEQFAATIFVNLPNDRGRVKDFLNQRLRFLPFFCDRNVVYLNFRYILEVED